MVLLAAAETLNDLFVLIEAETWIEVVVLPSELIFATLAD